MSSSVNHYRVAAIQFEPRLGAKAENIARLLELTETAARQDARLIVLPEMATTGYCWYDREEIRPHVEPIPGPTTAIFGDIARHFGCYVVVGMPEVVPRTGIFYNSAVLVGPAGVVGVYRKTHSYAADMKWAKDGDLGLPVWQTELGRIGIMICMDAGYFEPARLLALAGADVLCFPTNWLGEKSPGPAWITRAYENGCYLVGANRYGLERGVQFSGGSCVLNPDGTIQAAQDIDDGIVYGDVSLATARAKSFGVGMLAEKLSARRPELYDNLTLSNYLWNPLEFHGLYNHQPLPPGRRSLATVAQIAPRPGDCVGNFALLEQAFADMSEPSEFRDQADVDLIVFPEYALTGCPTAERLDIALSNEEALAWHGRLVELTQRYDTYMVVGYAEQFRGQIFSAALLAGPDGVLAIYHKTHIVGAETAWCSRGSEKPPVINLPLGRVGLLIGTDLCFPEPARTLAIAGCDLIAVAAGPGLPPLQRGELTRLPLKPPGIAAADPYHFHLARQRAFENNCYLAFASLPPPQGIGCSSIFGPDPIYRTDEKVLDADEGLVVSAIDTTNFDMLYPSSPVRIKELVRMRQTQLYDELQI
ncbi:MAG TPA: nitrilase-related carbon-nitrogen hydrolase [Roseiflexaceae bacterium]|nr:nitrilase-related carbon-nitrogen hydrolase [Roseiflexaceae bacterium]